MKPIFTRTFFRFLLAFLAIIAISCSLLVLTSVAQSRTEAAVIESLLLRGGK